jgi:hypothetical protein
MKITSRAACLGLLVATFSAVLYGQAPAAQPPAQDSQTKAPSGTSSSDSPAPETKRFRRFSYGARFRWWSTQPFDGSAFNVQSTQTQISHAYSTTSAAGRYSVGPAFDLNFTSHVSIRAEAFFQHLEYTKVTQVYEGTVASGTLNVTYTEHTRTGYWDFPVLVRFQGSPRPPAPATSTSSTSRSTFHLPLQGLTSHMFIEGGGILRNLMNVRTGNDTLNSDNSTAYNETPVRPAHRTVGAAVIGVGLHFADDFNLKVMPEVRYMFWSAPSFESESTLSRTRQLEVGLSIVF